MSVAKTASISVVLAATLCLGLPAQAQQAPAGAPAAKTAASTLSRNASNALNRLTSKSPTAKALGEKATAILVFPSIKKAGFVIGGQYGEGTLFSGGKPTAYYSTGGVSYGLQAGAQEYGYAMFFMNDKALAQLDKADGFEVGVGPSVVVVDEGMAKNRDHDDDEGRHLRVRLRPDGADGRHRPPGQQDHPDRPRNRSRRHRGA